MSHENSTKPKMDCRHIVLYYDGKMKELDGKGWCVNLDSLATAVSQRFESFSDAQMFITDNSWWFMPALNERENNE